MNDKIKKILMAMMLSCIALNIYAFDMSGLLGANELFDVMFAQMLVQFYSMKYFFFSIMKTTAVLFAIVGSFWWVMKIVLMGESVEKAIIDIVTKVILYIVIASAYPSIVDGCLGLATQIGMEMGLNNLNDKFTTMSNEVQLQMNAAQLARNMGLVEELVFEQGIPISKDSKFKSVNKKALGEFAKAKDVDPAQLEKWLYACGYYTHAGKSKNSFWGGRKTSLTDDDKVGHVSGSVYFTKIQAAADALKHNDGGEAIKAFCGNNKTSPEYFDNMAAVLSAKLKKGWTSLKKVSLNGVSEKDARTRLIALSRVCFPEKAQQEALIKQIDDAAKNMDTVDVGNVMKLNPYMPVSDDPKDTGALGNGNLILSPSAVMKVGLLCASLANTNANESINSQESTIEKTTYEDDEEDEYGQKKEIKTEVPRSEVKKYKRNLVEWAFDHIMLAICNVAIVFGILMCSVYFVIQYIMMICEYYLVAAICYILLPCLMWEVTASYAKTLFKLMVSYFMKTMVMLIVLMWAYGCYLDLANYLISVGLGEALSTLMNVIFTLVLTMAFVGEAPKIAQTILTGNPDMSMGEFMKQAVVVGGAAKAAGKATAKTAGMGIKGGMAVHNARKQGAQKKEQQAQNKEQESKASDELVAARGEQSAAGNALSDAKQQTGEAAKGFDSASKNYATADSRVSESQKKYDDAKKAAEGKGEDSKEFKAMQDAEKQLAEDRAKRDDAKSRMDVAGDKLNRAKENEREKETKKKNADKKVEDKKKQMDEIKKLEKMTNKAPGTMRALGALAFNAAAGDTGVSRMLGMKGGFTGQSAIQKKVAEDSTAKGFDKAVKKLNAKKEKED